MTDIVDQAAVIEQEHLARALKASRAPVPQGEPGECDDCGEDHPRIVDGACPPCRDRAALRRRRLGGRD